MSEFVRVRSKSGPKQEFDAPADWVALHEERYERVKVSEPSGKGVRKSVGRNDKEER
jgi:hypothetical protein